MLWTEGNVVRSHTLLSKDLGRMEVNVHANSVDTHRGTPSILLASTVWNTVTTTTCELQAYPNSTRSAFSILLYRKYFRLRRRREQLCRSHSLLATAYGDPFPRVKEQVLNVHYSPSS